MFSTIRPDEIETAAQGTYWTILILFLVLATVGWLTIGKSWFQNDTTAPGSNEQTESISLDEAE